MGIDCRFMVTPVHPVRMKEGPSSLLIIEYVETQLVHKLLKT